jgi:hypothetical protein
VFRDVTSGVVTEVNREGYYYHHHHQQQQQDDSQTSAPVSTKRYQLVMCRCDVSGYFFQTGCAVYRLLQVDQCGCNTQGNKK